MSPHSHVLQHTTLPSHAVTFSTRYIINATNHNAPYLNTPERLEHMKPLNERRGSSIALYRYTVNRPVHRIKTVSAVALTCNRNGDSRFYHPDSFLQLFAATARTICVRESRCIPVFFILSCYMHQIGRLKKYMHLSAILSTPVGYPDTSRTVSCLDAVSDFMFIIDKSSTSL